MSEHEQEMDDERGESYLEIQMDRSTIVLAALGLVVLLAGAFLLGSWFGSRADATDAVDGAETAIAAEADDDLLADHDGEEVAGESGFGGATSVSAVGAPPVSAVPQARAAVIEDISPRPTAAKLTAAKATAARATAAKPTAAKATAPKPTAAKSTAAAASASAGGWIVQVAAVKDKAEAEQLAERLRRKGWPVRVVEDAGYVKVHVGPYDSQAEGRTAEQRLKREERLGTWLKRG